MLNVTIKVNGMKAVLNKLGRLPAEFGRAQNSALGSMGFLIRKELKNHLKTQGSATFQPYHGLRKEVRLTKAGRWAKQTSRYPLSWLSAKTWYWVDESAGVVHIGLQATKGPRPSSSLDADIQKWIAKHEAGFSIPVTPEIRRLLAKGFQKAGMKQLRRTTQSLTVPKRPPISPVAQKVKGMVEREFEKKIINNVRRYMAEGASQA